MRFERAVIQQAIDFMEKNLDKEISLDKIARTVGYSKFHLNRIFTQGTGRTIYQYLQARRLTVAAEKLAKTQTPIVQIAFESGYQSQQAFSLAFKRLYACPPQAYRRRGAFTPKQNKISLGLYPGALRAFAGARGAAA